MNVRQFRETFGRAKTQLAVFDILKDRKWHCRGCGYPNVQTAQLAGSGGIRGLKMGSRDRNGIEIVSENRYCSTCETTKRHDRWTGTFIKPTSYGRMKPAVAQRIFKVLGQHDIVDQASRSPNHLTIDHKFPLVRCTPEESERQTDYSSLTEVVIRERFQVLKKSDGADHNLLKSRACEICYSTGKRGTPMGIKWFYDGDHQWRGKSRNDPAGCIGCGWFDFAEWRRRLNAHLNSR